MASFCPNCGNPLPDFGRFCPKCGQEINTESASQDEAYQAPQEQFQNQYSYQQDQGWQQQDQGWQQPNQNWQQPNQNWQQPAPKKSKAGLIIGLVVLLLAGLGAVACFVWPGFLNDKQEPAPTTATATATEAPTAPETIATVPATQPPVTVATATEAPTAPATEAAPGNPFLDVSEDDPCYNEYLWAYTNGVISGDRLNGDQILTRGEVMELLWKVFGRPAPLQTEMPFTDITASDSCYPAVLWAYSIHLVSGSGEGLFNPNNSMTRDQVAAVLFKAMKGDATGLPQAYTDVGPDQYYYKAVNWGCSKGILERGSDFLFRPSDPLPRSVFICWLARAMNPDLALEPGISQSPIAG